MKKHILFVDDEPNVLRGIERGLRGMREQWEVCLANDGMTALEMLQKQCYDVVVSDMRMPGIDGADLLSQVRQRYPRTVRVALSGQSDQAAILRAMGATHQYLSKPCEIDDLKRKLDRVLMLQDMLTNPKLQEAVSRLETVPSEPENFAALQALLESDQSSSNEAAKIIGRDMGMTAKVLQILSSSFLGTPWALPDIRRAIPMIGIPQFRTLALSVRLFSPWEGTLGPELTAIWKESLAIATLAQSIAAAENDDKTVADSAFLAGLLHDIGRLVLATACPDEYRAVIENAERRKISVEASEYELLGCTHAQIGGYLLGLWGLPEPVVKAVAWHHEPARGGPEGFCPLIAVHVADVFGQQYVPPAPGVPRDSVDEGLLQQLGIAAQLPLWQRACQATEIGGANHG